MPVPFRFAVCNEVYDKVPFAETCRRVKKLGYDGIEIAHFTLADSPSQISAADRKEYRHMIAEEGLAFAGLHWILVAPAGLHVTTPDASVRSKSWEHVRQLVDLSADLGDNGVMVFGSPKQRSTTAGTTPREAVHIFTEELARVAPHAEERNVRILVEALPSNQSNVINTLQEAVAIVDEIGSSAVRTMFDTHNAVDEVEPHAELVRKYFNYIEHVHVNELDGREPGTGDYDFAALLKTLADLDYAGWVSLEAFDFSRDPDTIAGGSLNFLKRQLPTESAARLSTR